MVPAKDVHLEALERRLHELIPAGGRLDYDEVGQVVALAAHLTHAAAGRVVGGVVVRGRAVPYRAAVVT